MKDLQDSKQVLENVKTELTNENTKLKNEKTELAEKNQKLTAEKENLTNQLNASQKQVKALEQSQQALKNGNDELLKDREKLTTQNTELAEKIEVLTTEKTELNNKITRLTTDKENLTKDKENLTTVLSTAKTQAEQTSQKLNELERKHAPYQKLEKLYEAFLEVKDRLNFNFVATTHSAMDLIASVLSDSKYYLESLYNKASQELSDKRSDKGEKLAELFDLLFEYIKDSKFERLKEPSAYDYSCKTLYPEQNTSQKMQRVVLRGYKHNDKVYYTIVDMGS
ncbi:M protein [Helicobacter pylori]|uniref:M protein n=1 Tax=Helicobacter pylori TaxID=210 RepID=UPI003F7503FF